MYFKWYSIPHHNIYFFYFFSLIQTAQYGFYCARNCDKNSFPQHPCDDNGGVGYLVLAERTARTGIPL